MKKHQSAYTTLERSERRAGKKAKLIGPADPKELLTVTILVRRSRKAEPLPSQVELARTSFPRREYIKRADIQKKHGADQADIDRVVAFAKSKGLEIVEANAARRTVKVSGTVALMNKAFAVKLGRYQTPEEIYRGREGFVSVPKVISSLVEGVFGLDNRRMAKRTGASAPGGATALTPPQVAKFYNFPTANAGGQTIGLIEFGGGFKVDANGTPTDIQSFLKSLGLKTPTVTVVSVDGVSNAPSNAQSDSDQEVALDISVASAVAQGAEIAVYFAPWTEQGWIDAISTAIVPAAGQPTPSVISISWGWPENETADGLQWTPAAIDAVSSFFSMAASLGITLFVASGDHGSDCGMNDGLAHVIYPASDPWVTACGGTVITGVSGTSFTEDTWNDESGATGGGVSAVFPIPAWQLQGLAAETQGQSSTVGIMRGIPDVAGNASVYSGYSIQVDGSTMVIGGTSGVAPLYAGLIATINAKIGTGVGYLNPTLYSLTDSTTGKNPLFRNIADGRNNLNQYDIPAPCYAAVVGWNGCTGLGVIDGTALLNWLTQLYESDLYISVTGETQQEQTQGGVVVGGYVVDLVASPRYSDFKSTGFTWTIDGQTVGQTAESISVFVPIGSKGTPLVYNHTVSATARNAQGGTVSASYNISFAKPRGNLIYAIDPGSRTKTTTQTANQKGGGWMRTTVSVPSLEDAVLEDLQYFFAPYNVTWLPSSKSVRGPAGSADATAVYTMTGSNVSVSATITDAIGQSLTLSVLLPGAIVTTTTGGGWKPPKAPSAAISHARGRRKRVTSAEMFAHLGLARQYSR